MRKIRLSLALAATCLLAVACSDDDPVKPEEFAVTVKVSNPAGDPVEGMQVGLANDHRFFPDGFPAAKAAVVIPFRNEFDVNVRLTIEDIEGNLVRVLAEGIVVAPQNQWTWFGTNEAGIHQPSGRYTAHLVATNPQTGLWVFEDREDILLSAPDYLFNGYTDQMGTLVLKDRKLFPHLYDKPDMMGHNENGEPVGLINLTSLMLVVLTDMTSGEYTIQKKDVLEGSLLELVWDPKRTRPVSRCVFEAVPADDPEEPPYFELGPVYPNPFN